MRCALGPEVALVQLLDTLQHTRALLEGTQEHASCTDALLQGARQVPWNVAKWRNVFVRVLYALLVIAVKVLCRCDDPCAVIALLFREQHVVVDDRKELDEEVVNHLLNVQGILASSTSQAAG